MSELKTVDLTFLFCFLFLFILNLGLWVSMMSQTVTH